MILVFTNQPEYSVAPIPHSASSQESYMGTTTLLLCLATMIDELKVRNLTISQRFVLT